MTNDSLPTADDESEIETPKGIRGSREFRALLNAAAGAIPFVGGLLAASAGAWSEQEQAKVNAFLEHWIKMLQAGEDADHIGNYGAPRFKR
jgi:hypothetical protein